MIRIVTTFRVRPDAVEESRVLTGEPVEASRAEDGNFAYDLCVARDDSVPFVVLKTWCNDTAIETHNISAHFTILVPRTVGLCVESLSVTQYIEV